MQSFYLHILFDKIFRFGSASNKSMKCFSESKRHLLSILNGEEIIICKIASNTKRNNNCTMHLLPSALAEDSSIRIQAREP